MTLLCSTCLFILLKEQKICLEAFTASASRPGRLSAHYSMLSQSVLILAGAALQTAAPRGACSVSLRLIESLRSTTTGCAQSTLPALLQHRQRNAGMLLALRSLVSPVPLQGNARACHVSIVHHVKNTT